MTRERTRRVGCAIATMLACVVATGAQAQWHTSGFAAPGPDERVFALTRFDDGTGEVIYAGGSFTAIDGQPMSHIAQYKNGVWSPVGAGLAQDITCLTVFNGQVIAGGRYHSRNVHRWDGNAWEQIDDGLTSNSAVYALTVFNDELIAAGNLTTGGTYCHYARWNGKAWEPLGPNSSGRGYALEVFDGDLYGASASNVFRWNGTAWVSIGQFNWEVHSLTTHNGNLIAGGIFTAVGGMPANRIAQWNGSSWAPLAEGLSGPGVPDVLSMASVNGRLVVGGFFTTAGTIAANNLAEWDGASWSAIDSGVRWDLSPDLHNSGAVHALLPIEETRGQSDLIVGGVFSTAGSLAVNNIVRRSGDQWERMSECGECGGVSGPIRALLKHDDGRGEALFVAGACRVAGTVPINRIGRWDGASWSILGSGVDDGAWILSLAEFDDGSGGGIQLYAGGQFTSIGGVTAHNVARWDGQEWHALGAGVDGTVLAMTVFDDGSGTALYAGGNFTSAGGEAASGLAKWDGTSWSEFAGGVHLTGNIPAAIQDMIVWDDGSGPSLVVTGRFSSVGANPPLSVFHLARWKNQTWSMIGASGLGSGGFGKSLARWPGPDGTGLACAGRFGSVGGVASNGLAVWDGTIWQNLAPALTIHNDAFRLFSMWLGDCSELFIFARFDFNRPPEWWFVSRWNGLQRRSMQGLGGTNLSEIILGAIVDFGAFATFQDVLYVAGDFTSAGGQPASNIASWDVEASLSCLGDIDGDNVVNNSDLQAVINLWGPCDDCPEDPSPCGGDGVVNVNDLLQVITQWGPCP